ncbi:hypothetical protein GCM10027445_49790 [Amycolatopsis endophytica]|uniref:SnoaL-like domain-containing protein n=1 Tax=Amycolatopsis endophytica TaxID=860233 RepID=A0A853B2L4_9PSEU|nr:nuclear transport factor 2 family protein [Amycolatopsis endophytica]NYI89092.1 hypothetical protein [Amycolatopsis endophytica]
MEHIEISALVSRLFRALDERKFDGDWHRDYFTDEVRMVTPLGVSEGAEAVRHTADSVGRFVRTQHLATDLLTDIDGNAATASWNALMVHVHREATLERRGADANPVFTVGGHYDADLRRTPDGWRFDRMSIRAIWTTGQPPILPPEIQPVV